MSSENQGSSMRLIGFAAGVCSGVTKLSVGHPFDTIKTRIQCAPPGTFKGPLDCLKQTVKKEGLFAVYKGASPPLVGWMITDAVLLGSLHNYRLWLAAHGFSEPSPSGGTRLSIWGHAIAGCGAGWTNAVLAHPIETLKAKLQLQITANKSERMFSGPIDCARKIVEIQGLRGLWKGFFASIMFRSNFAFMFGGYEVCLRAFQKYDPNPANLPLYTFLAGGIGANAFWLGALPPDNIKNRIQTDSLTSPRYRGVRDAAAAIWREGGVKGFFKGGVPVVLRAFPTNASALFVYESVMRLSGAEPAR